MIYFPKIVKNCIENSLLFVHNVVDTIKKRGF